MLEWKSIHLEGKRFIGVYIALPKQKIYIIYSTKCILVGDVFDLHKMRSNISVCTMRKADSFASLLQSECTALNFAARNNGYTIGMKGKDILLDKNKKKQ